MQLGTKSDDSIVRINPARRGERFIAAAYITHLEETRSPRLRDLSAIAQGYMLANVLYLPDAGQTLKRFRDTDIYFDTPFLIYALGYNGSGRQAPARELLTLLYSTGANLKCFSHTRDEIKGALEACAGHVRRGPDAALRGPALETVQHFLAEGFTASDVELLAAQLERSLQAVHVRVVEAPSYQKHEHVIDEAGLAEELRQGERPYREGALEKDVASIAAIVRARAGRTTTSIEDSAAVFITTNLRLVRVVRESFARESSGYSVPPCVSDYSLTNLLWLKRPTAAPNLPIQRLMADSYAALQPDEELWSAFEVEAKKLRDQATITPDDYYDLRYSLTAKAELMEVTGGDVEAIAQGTVLEVLKRVQAHREEVARDQVAAELEQARAGQAAAEAKVSAHEAQLLTQRSGLHLRSQRIARWVARILFLVLLVVLGIGAWASSPWGLTSLSGSVVGHALSILAATFLLAGLISVVVGGTARDFVRSAEIACERGSMRFFLRLANLPEESSDRG
jgi:hypothetical protein